MMHLRQTVVVAVIIIVICNVADPAALSLAHGGVECGQNPMHAVQLVAQQTGKYPL